MVKSGLMSVERQNQNPYVYPETARFFQLAIQDQAYLRMRFDPHYDSLSWRERRWSIFLSYLFTSLSLRDIAPLYNLKSGERVRQIVEDMKQRLYSAVSEEVLPALPPFESLHFGKPQAVFGRKISQDKTPPAALQRRNNILEDPNSSASKVDAVLSALSAGQARHLIRQGLLLPVQSIVFEVGYHFRYQPDCLEPFLNVLKRRDIPVGYAGTEVKTKGRIVNQQYHFIAANHHDRAVAALLASRRLDKYLKHPVDQVAGPLSNLPFTTELAQKRGFERVGKLVRELGGRFNSRMGMFDILDNHCPAPIFTAKRGGYCYFYPANQEEALRTYLQGRLAVLKDPN